MADRSDTSGGVVVRRPSQSPVAVIVIIVLILIIIIVVILYFLLRNSGSTSGTTTSTRSCFLDTDCTGTQVCDTSIGQCVECNLDSDCPFSRPLCNADLKKCVVCNDSTDCSGTRSICDSTSHQCVGCQTSLDCSGSNPLCNDETKLCVGCISDIDCGLAEPICSQAISQCVECLTNSNCTLPAVCSSGRCCDQTAPTITSVVGRICTHPDGLSILVNYSFSQPPSGLTAIFEIADSVGVVITTTAGFAATGSQVIKTPNQGTAIPVLPIFYRGFTYKIRVRLSQTCGLTPYSVAMSVLIPGATIPVPLPYVPVITTVQNITPSGFRIRTNPPDGTAIIILTSVMVVYLIPSTNVNLDPNLAQVVLGSVLGSGTDGIIDVNWPFAAPGGTKRFVRVAVNSGCGVGVVSNAFLVIVP